MKIKYFTHSVITYRGSYILCTFVTNFSVFKTQPFECLHQIVNISIQQKKQSLLLCFFVNHQQDIVHLYRRCHSDQEVGLQVTITHIRNVNITEREVFNLTTLSCKAFDKYCAPWLPIWLFLRLSVLIV